jgi:hypothetical protein
MPLNISFEPLRVLIDGHDSEGNLVLSDGQLAAVIVRLDGEHHDPEHEGLWYLEGRRQFNELKAKRLFGSTDQKPTAMPVTSVQAAKALARDWRRSAALEFAG